jgi:hypothetical protein
LLVFVATIGGLIVGFGLALMRLSTPADPFAGGCLCHGDALAAAGAGAVLVLFLDAARDRPTDRLARPRR